VPADVIRALTDGAPHHLSYGEWPASLRRALKQSLQVSRPVIGIRLTQLGLAAGPGATKSFHVARALGIGVKHVEAALVQ